MQPEALPPPAPRFARDPATNLVVGRQYRYTPEGKIDWRAEVDPKHLYVAREKEAAVMKEQGVTSIIDIDLLKVRDDWLRIRVGGINQLAHLRGVRSCRYTLQTREGHAAVVCEMEFLGNIESGMQPEVWSGIASANIRSVDKHFIPYIETFAENRAFTRCVKRALQINILSDVEVGGEGKKAADGGREEDSGAATGDGTTPDSGPPAGFQPHHYLAKLCADHKDPQGRAQPIAFQDLKGRAVALAASQPPLPANEQFKDDPNTWLSFESIGGADSWLLMGRIEAADKKAAEAKASPKGK